MYVTCGGGKVCGVLWNISFPVWQNTGGKGRKQGDRGSNAGGECARHGLSGSHMPGCK